MPAPDATLYDSNTPDVWHLGSTPPPGGEVFFIRVEHGSQVSTELYTTPIVIQARSCSADLSVCKDSAPLTIVPVPEPAALIGLLPCVLLLALLHKVRHA